MGNYVVQNILGQKLPHVTSEILKQLQGSFVSLSMNKYGSNVQVEKCLEESENEQAMQVVEEIISSPNLLMLLQDQYGNSDVQSAIPSPFEVACSVDKDGDQKPSPGRSGLRCRFLLSESGWNLSDLILQVTNRSIFFCRTTWKN